MCRIPVKFSRNQSLTKGNHRNLSPTVEFSFRNYVTGLHIKSTYTEMSYLISQLEERKSERKIKLAIRDKLINNNYNS